MIEDVRVAVSGGTPGADTNDYILFDSTVCFGGGLLVAKGIDRAQLGLNNSQSGSLKSYFSADKGTTWNLNSTTSVTANGGGTAGPYDFELDGFGDWKLVWTNGGSAQGTWITVLTLSRGQRASGV